MSGTNVGSIYYEVDARTGKLIQARKQADDSFNSIERGAKRADRGVKMLNTSLKMLSRLIPTILAANVVKQFVTMAEQSKTLRVKIGMLTDSAEDAEKVFRGIRKISDETGQSIKDTSELWEGLAISLKNSSATQSQILNITGTLQKMGALGGASAEQMSNSMRQFRQAIDGGVLRAEEFNSLLENTPTIVQTMARQMGLSMGQFRAKMLDGKITAEDMVNAIQASTAEVNEQFAKLPNTSEKALTRITNSFFDLAEKVDDTFGVTDNLVKLMEGAKIVIEGTGKVIDFTKNCLVTLKDAGVEFVNKFSDVAMTADDVAKKIWRIVSPVIALMDAYKWAKGVAAEATADFNDDYDKKYGKRLGKGMLFRDQWNAVLQQTKEEKEKKDAANGKIKFKKDDGDDDKNKKNQKNQKI